jgi:DNA mismatch endonuclease (patch repair protein)
LVDIVSPAVRSRIMGKIAGRNTIPERAVRTFLHAHGFRFRLHAAGLPGRPDLILPRYKVAIFVNGCFWHQHSGCPDAAVPKSNRTFWRKKLSGNVARDKRCVAALLADGWRVALVWECAVRRASSYPIALDALVRWISGRRRTGIFP